MIVKKVNRYYCEYCKKAGCSGGHISRHEKRCTKNPNRECGCCQNLLVQEQPNLADIIALLPIVDRDALDCTRDDFDWEKDKSTQDQIAVELKDIFPKVREMAKNCPVCIFSALQQSGIPPSWLKDFFNFKEELSEAWNVFNERQLRREYPMCFGG
jgi:hypothetical protein